MATQVTATEAKTRLLQLLDEVENGEQIEITRRGKTIARLVPARGPHALKGIMVGVARTVDPDDDLLSTGVRWNAQD
jgi:prevent-host-death family protein